MRCHTVVYVFFAFLQVGVLAILAFIWRLVLTGAGGFNLFGLFLLMLLVDASLCALVLPWVVLGIGASLSRGTEEVLKQYVASMLEAHEHCKSDGAFNLFDGGVPDQRKTRLMHSTRGRGIASIHGRTCARFRSRHHSRRRRARRTVTNDLDYSMTRR